MSEDIQKKIFSRNLNDLLETQGKTQLEVANAIGVSPQSFNTWTQGKILPRMGKIQLLADYFGINKSDLLEEKTEPDSSDIPAYYYDEEAASAAEFLYKNPEYKVLFDASRKVKAEDIEFVKRMIDRMNGDDGSDA